MGPVADISSISVVEDERRKEGVGTRSFGAEKGVAAFLTRVCCLVTLTGCCAWFVEAGGTAVGLCCETFSILRVSISSLETRLVTS